MPRFYLHIHNSHGAAEDDEGADLASLAEAHEKAISGIRSLLSAEAMNGTINLNGHIEIKTETGQVLNTVAFSEAMQIIESSQKG